VYFLAVFATTQVCQNRRALGQNEWENFSDFEIEFFPQAAIYSSPIHFMNRLSQAVTGH